MIFKIGFPFSSLYVFYQGKSFSSNGPEIWSITAISVMISLTLYTGYVKVFESLNVNIEYGETIFNSKVTGLFFFIVVFFTLSLFYLRGDRWKNYVIEYDKLNEELKYFLSLLSFLSFFLVCGVCIYFLQT